MNRDEFTIHTDKLNLKKFKFMNILTPVKNFVKMDRENKASRLCVIGFLGILAVLALDVCKLLPKATAVDLTLGAFIVLFGTGCLMMCTVLIKHETKAARFAGCGAFGLFGLMCTECVADYLVEHLASVMLPQVTAWYAYPCVTLFFIGILMLAREAISEAWRRA